MKRVLFYQSPRQLVQTILLLVLLRSPARSLGFTILGEIFAYVTVFFILTIEVVTFRLREWCMLGVFLLLALTRLGHERQDLLSTCGGSHCVNKLDPGLYSHPKEFVGKRVRAHFNSKGKIPSTGKILPRGGSNPRRCIKQDSEPNTLTMSYSGPRCKLYLALRVIV